MKHYKAYILCGILLLAVSFLSCAKREEKADKAAPKTAGGALSADARQLMALLPEDDAVPGWKRKSEVRFFNPDDLFEYIDGAAENYLIYDFQQVVTTEYGHPQKSSEAVVEIYKMRDPRGAFGIYASELNPNSEFLPIGAEGYIGGTALHFRSGPYYAKITVFQESEDLKQDMKLFAGRLSEKMGLPGDVLPEIAQFPARDQVPHSMRYFPKDALGQTYLKEAFQASYRKGGNEYKILIANPGDSDTAKEALARYRQFIASGGRVIRDVTAPGDGGFLGQDSFYGNMAALRSGNRIVIALGGPSADFAFAQAGAVLK